MAADAHPGSDIQPGSLRLLKVFRAGELHGVKDVRVRYTGPAAGAFRPDPARVQALAEVHLVASIEEFALLLLRELAHPAGVTVEVSEDLWSRVVVPGPRGLVEAPRAFMRAGAFGWVAHAGRGSEGDVLRSGIEHLPLSHTGGGWPGVPGAPLLAELDARWEHGIVSPGFEERNDAVLQSLLEVHGRAVDAPPRGLLQEMAEAALRGHDFISSIELALRRPGSAGSARAKGATGEVYPIDDSVTLTERVTLSRDSAPPA